MIIEINDQYQHLVMLHLHGSFEQRSGIPHGFHLSHNFKCDTSARYESISNTSSSHFKHKINVDAIVIA